MGKSEIRVWEISLEFIIVIQVRNYIGLDWRYRYGEKWMVLSFIQKDKWIGFDDELEVVVGKGKGRLE